MKNHSKLCSFNETQVNMLFSYSAAFPGECCLQLVAYTGRVHPSPFSYRRLHRLELIWTEINRRNSEASFTIKITLKHQTTVPFTCAQPYPPATDSCPTEIKTYHQGMAIGQKLGWKGFAKLIARMTFSSPEPLGLICNRPLDHIAVHMRT